MAFALFDNDVTDDDQTPDEFYFKNLPALPKAAQALTARHPLKKWEKLSNQVELLLNLTLL